MFTPAGPTSKASVEVRPMTAIFEAQYGVPTDQRPFARHRGDVNHITAAALHHRRQERLADQENATHVDVEDLIPVDDLDLGQRSHRSGHPGVVDQDRDLGVGQTVGQRRHRSRVGHVADGPPGPLAQLCADLLEQVSPAPDQHHLGAGRVQGAGDRGTEPVAAAGDQRRAPGQAHESASATVLFSAASIHWCESPRCFQARTIAEAAESTRLGLRRTGLARVAQRQIVLLSAAFDVAKGKKRLPRR